MCKERTKETKSYIPMMVCPECVQAGLQIDPRAKTPAYPVIESTCFTHLVIQGKVHPLAGHPSTSTQIGKKV